MGGTKRRGDPCGSPGDRRKSCIHDVRSCHPFKGLNKCRTSSGTKSDVRVLLPGPMEQNRNDKSTGLAKGSFCGRFCGRRFAETAGWCSQLFEPIRWWIRLLSKAFGQQVVESGAFVVILMYWIMNGNSRTQTIHRTGRLTYIGPKNI